MAAPAAAYGKTKAESPLGGAGDGISRGTWLHSTTVTLCQQSLQRSCEDAGTRVAYQNWGINGAGMVAVSGAYRQFHDPANQRRIASDLLAVELAVPVTSRLKWNTKVAHGQGLGDEFFRFGQAYNGETAIKTTAGWTELVWRAARRLNVATGYGLDNPLGKDLIGISNNNSNYHRNARWFGDGVIDLGKGVNLGLEVNYLHTNWTDGSRYSAYQPMASFFYSF